MPREVPADIQAGQVITASFLNAVKNAVLRSLTGGKGIAVNYAGSNATISLTTPMPGIKKPIPAKITAAGATGSGYYTAVEQVWDKAGAAWIDKPGGRTWDGATGNLPEVYEQNATTGLDAGTFIEIRQSPDNAQGSAWWFKAPGEGGGGAVEYTHKAEFTADDTWIIPAGTTVFRIIAVGGGGAGADPQTIDGIVYGGGGGGAGETTITDIFLDSPADGVASLDITVGQGGTYGAFLGTDGTSTTVVMGADTLAHADFGNGGGDASASGPGNGGEGGSGGHNFVSPQQANGFAISGGRGESGSAKHGGHGGLAAGASNFTVHRFTGHGGFGKGGGWFSGFDGNDGGVIIFY